MATPEKEITGTWEEIAARASEFVGRRVKLILVDDSPAEEAQPAQTIEERIQDIFADVPEEEWNKLPPDFTEQLDHYIYGLPKRE